MHAFEGKIFIVYTEVRRTEIHVAHEKHVNNASVSMKLI